MTELVGLVVFGMAWGGAVRLYEILRHRAWVDTYRARAHHIHALHGRSTP